MPDPELELLRRFGCSERVVEHCITVSRVALDIADRVKIRVDRGLIRQGALLHDLGRCKTHSIAHGVVGAKLIEGARVPPEVVRIVERHIGAGIPEAEARELGLPPKDYFPVTPEEKIVAYADKLARGSQVVTFQEALDDMRRSLGKDHPAIERLKNLHEEIQGWLDHA